MTETEWVEHLDLCARSHSAHLSAEQFAALRDLLAALLVDQRMAQEELNLAWHLVKELRGK